MDFLDSDLPCPDCGQAMCRIIGITPDELEIPDGIYPYSDVFICWGCKITRWYRAERPTKYTYEAQDKYAAQIQRYPRLKDKSRDLWMAIWQEFDRQTPPMSVRQMFYRMSVQGQVDKTENGYRRVQNALAEMRRAGAIPYTYLADNTRWVRKPRSFSNLGAALADMQKYYRRELWSRQPAYIEIWLEKEALAGVIHGITEQYDVPLYVTRGYASMSYLYAAAEQLKTIDKPAYIYHLGDYDASGQDAARAIRDSLRSFGAQFEFIQAAVRPEQVSQFNLQTRPAKSSDPRAAKHGKVAVELDAIEPVQLRAIVSGIIEHHIDRDELARVQQIQDAERSTIDDIINAFHVPAALPYPTTQTDDNLPADVKAKIAALLAKHNADNK